MNLTFVNIFASCLTVWGREALFHAHIDFLWKYCAVRIRVLVLVLVFSLSFMGNGFYCSYITMKYKGFTFVRFLRNAWMGITARFVASE